MAEYPPEKDDAKKKGPKGGWAKMRANAEDVEPATPPSPEEAAEQAAVEQEAVREETERERNKEGLAAYEARRAEYVSEKLEPELNDIYATMTAESLGVPASELVQDADTHEEKSSRFKSFMKGAAEKLGGAKESVGKGYEASAAFLAQMGKAVAKSLREVAVGEWQDIKAAGSLITNAEYRKEKIKSAQESAAEAKKYLAYFAERGRTWDERFKKLQEGSPAFLDWYNALPAHRKLNVSVALAAGAGVASGVSATASGVLMGLMYSQRVLAGFGFARKRYQGVEEKIAKGEHWLFDADSPNWKKVAYASALGAAYSGVTAAAGYGFKEFVAHELYGPAPASEPVATPIVHAPDVPLPAEVIAAQHPAMPIAPELPPFSVEAHAGDGGIKLFRHLQEAMQKAPGFDPNHLTPVQEHILHGDPTKLAEEYGFYKPNEALESARVLTGSSLGFDAHGSLVFTQHGAAETLAQNHGYEGAFVHAGHHAAESAQAHQPVPEARPEPQAPAAHEQMRDVRARLGMSERQETAELNQMSYESTHYLNQEAAKAAAQQASAEHLAPSTSGTHVTQMPPLEPGHGGKLVEAYAVPPGAEHAVPGTEAAPVPAAEHFIVNAHGLSVDTSHAHDYFAQDGKTGVVFGGSVDERVAKAQAWVTQYFANTKAPDPNFAVYFDSTRPSFWRALGFKPHYEISKAFLDPVTHKIQVATDIMDPSLRGMQLPTVNDLFTQVDLSK